MPKIPPLTSALKWAQHIFGHAKLGDPRRTKRLITVAADLAKTPGVSLVQASGKSEAAVEGAYRFVRNPQVQADAIGRAGFEATAAVAKQHATLVEIQDTTTLSYAHQGALEMGDLGGKQDSDRRGALVHSSLLVDGDSGDVVGLLDMETWMRPAQQRGTRHQRKQRAYPDKESFKWERTAQRVRERLGPEAMATVVSVSDRESDIYQYLADKLRHKERFVVRASWNRTVQWEEQSEWTPLWEALGDAPPVGRMVMEIPQRGGRQARQADMEVRALRSKLRRPQRVAGSYPAHLEVNVVRVREEEPRLSEPEPLEWVLLTWEPIQTPQQVLDIVGWYRMRWKIEEFHKVWKTGVGVERLRLQTAQNLLRMAIILAFVAIRLGQVRDLLARDPEGSCEQVLKPLEWKVLWAVVENKALPQEVPSLRWAYYAVARLAGWIDTKGTGRVGWATIWRGWFKLQERMEGFHAASIVGGG